LASAFAIAGAATAEPPIRVGIIGCDTSHVEAFTSIINKPVSIDDTAGVRVVAAFPGGSSDIPSSRDRVQGYVQKLQSKFGVEIVDSIETLLTKVDAVLLESVDGRPHLEQATPVLKAHKRMFIDKPVAGSLTDAIRIYQLAEKEGTPIFSSSALRFSKGIASAASDPKFGGVKGCLAYSPCELEEHHPDLFWYGIHGVETLFTVMGPGCKSVVRTHTKGTDVVTGTWKDGRVGTFYGLRDAKHDFGALVFGAKSVGSAGGFTGYEPMVVEICRFFKTGKPPVDAKTTLEIYAFMEAADESKRHKGAPVELEAVSKLANALVKIESKIKRGGGIEPLKDE
jgi:hypothetical protein